MPAWNPSFRVNIADEVYTTVTSVSYSTGRTDIDRQSSAGYCRIEIVNTTGAPFTINLADPITLLVAGIFTSELMVWSGTVSDFNIGVRSAEDVGFVTTGTILGIGNLVKLNKTIYNTALAEGLDGAQIAAILNEALLGTWEEVNPAYIWVAYPFSNRPDATIVPTTWDMAENYVGNVDAGFYTMISQAASATAKSQSLADQIANSALGQVWEDRAGLINYDDADHRSVYLTANGYTTINGDFATPNSLRSTSGTNRMRNSLIYKYGAGYGSTYSTSDSTSVATYGLFEISRDSNIKNLVDIAAIGTRELGLRKDPRDQLEAITFRLTNPAMSDQTRARLLILFFGRPVTITNLPSNFFGGSFSGFTEGISLNATPSYVDITLFVSATDLSIV
jgi:hypothetical protein